MLYRPDAIPVTQQTVSEHWRDSFWNCYKWYYIYSMVWYGIL